MNQQKGSDPKHCMDIINLPRGWIKEIGLLTFDRESVYSIRSYKLGNKIGPNALSQLHKPHSS